MTIMSTKINKSKLTKLILEETIKALNNASGFISKHISNKLNFKSTPALKFRIDNSISDGSLLSQKISQIVTGNDDEKNRI